MGAFIWIEEWADDPRLHPAFLLPGHRPVHRARRAGRVPRQGALDLDAGELRGGSAPGRRLPRHPSAPLRGQQASGAHRGLHPLRSPRLLHAREAPSLAPPSSPERGGGGRGRGADAPRRPRPRPQRLDDHLRRRVPQLHRRRDHRRGLPRRREAGRGDIPRHHRPRDPPGDRQLHGAAAFGLQQAPRAILEPRLGHVGDGGRAHRLLRLEPRDDLDPRHIGVRGCEHDLCGGGRPDPGPAQEDRPFGFPRTGGLHRGGDREHLADPRGIISRGLNAMSRNAPPPDADRFAAQLREAHDKFSASMSGEGPSQQVMSGFAEAYRAWLEAMSAKPETMMDLQGRYMQEQMRLWMNSMQPASSEPEASSADKRFSGKEWSELPVFRYFRDSYLLTSKMMMQAVEEASLDAPTKQRMRFFMRQYLDAAAPSNYLMTNPEALKAAMESGGETLQEGMRNLLADMEKGRISMTDDSAFEVGRNIAVSPRAGVFQSELLQLIQ